jgi:demethylmenaquinone methyltransferase/2-methoxy-6-polyprenyl-1,4-benzoquinol methylase
MMVAQTFLSESGRRPEASPLRGDTGRNACATIRLSAMPDSAQQPAPQNARETAWDEQLLSNPHAVADKRRRVREMFAAIAPSYDLNNRLHSLWQDQRWRRKAVKLAQLKPTDVVVDVACGTGDLALEFAQQIRKLIIGDRWPEFLFLREIPKWVIGIDFTFQMLPIALHKTPWIHWADNSGVDCVDGRFRHNRWINGDAQSLPLPDNSADVVSIAFGIRNVQDPAAALREFHRILRPGGRVIVLEFSLPTNPILRGLYNFYFRQILPRTATWISGDKTGAYKYLPQSVNTFIGRSAMMSMMRDAGFAQVEQHAMTFGVCVCYRGVVAG